LFITLPKCFYVTIDLPNFRIVSVYSPRQNHVIVDNKLKKVGSSSNKLNRATKSLSSNKSNTYPSHDNQYSSVKVDSPFIKLQRQIGNQGVLRLLSAGKIQTKLEISHPGDIYEQEAEKIANNIMQKPNDKSLEYDSSSETIENRDDNECLKISKSSASNDIEIPEDFLHEMKNAAQDGISLDKETRTFMESRFGYDFSQIRIHTDEKASRSASNLGSIAYTNGIDIFFGSGQYRPQTREGKRLIAHELAHTIQQDIKTVRKKRASGGPYYGYSSARNQSTISRQSATTPPTPAPIVEVAGGKAWLERGLFGYKLCLDERMTQRVNGLVNIGAGAAAIVAAIAAGMTGGTGGAASPVAVPVAVIAGVISGCLWMFSGYIGLIDDGNGICIHSIGSMPTPIITAR